jgi:hypothetical protein
VRVALEEQIDGIVPVYVSGNRGAQLLHVCITSFQARTLHITLDVCQ